MIDQLRLGFNHPVIASPNGESAFHRECQRAAFSHLPHALFIAAEAVDPSTAGRQVDVPALRSGEAPVGAKALALQVEGVRGGVSLGATGQQTIAVALKLTRAAGPQDSLAPGPEKPCASTSSWAWREGLP